MCDDHGVDVAAGDVVEQLRQCRIAEVENDPGVVPVEQEPAASLPGRRSAARCSQHHHPPHPRSISDQVTRVAGVPFVDASTGRLSVSCPWLRSEGAGGIGVCAACCIEVGGDAAALFGASACWIDARTRE